VRCRGDRVNLVTWSPLDPGHKPGYTLSGRLGSRWPRLGGQAARECGLGGGGEVAPTTPPPPPGWWWRWRVPPHPRHSIGVAAIHPHTQVPSKGGASGWQGWVGWRHYGNYGPAPPPAVLDRVVIPYCTVHCIQLLLCSQSMGHHCRSNTTYFADTLERNLDCCWCDGIK